MNVYDEAHTLARAIKESEEFKHYDETKKKVDANPELSSMLKDFEQKQIEVQAKQLMKEEISADTMAAFQSMYAVVMRDPLIMEHLNNEMRLSMMIGDVYKIINESVGLGKLPE